MTEYELESEDCDMGKITDFSTVENLIASNIFLVDGGENGTRTITAANAIKSMLPMANRDAFFAMLDEIGNPILHRLIYRGKNLGTTFTTAQKEAIQAGTFTDIWLGDYWNFTEPGGDAKTFLVADFDYWLNCGDTGFTSHHIVVIPYSRLYTAKMNDTNTTEGGYYNSKMRGGTDGIASGNLARALTWYQSAFGDALLTHRDSLSNAVTEDGKVAGVAWYDSIIDLPSEVMIYGARHRSESDQYTTINKTQLALMQAAPKHIVFNNTQDYWLRDVAGTRGFVIGGYYGGTYYDSASNVGGVRPVAAIG